MPSGNILVELPKLLKNAVITLPAVEITLLLGLLALCLVLRFSRVGLIIAYLFTYRWAWQLLAGQDESFLLAYLTFGVIVGILTVIGMMRTSSEN